MKRVLSVFPLCGSHHKHFQKKWKWTSLTFVFKDLHWRSCLLLCDNQLDRVNSDASQAEQATQNVTTSLSLCLLIQVYKLIFGRHNVTVLSLCFLCFSTLKLTLYELGKTFWTRWFLLIKKKIEISLIEVNPTRILQRKIIIREGQTHRWSVFSEHFTRDITTSLACIKDTLWQLPVLIMSKRLRVMFAA